MALIQREIRLQQAFGSHTRTHLYISHRGVEIILPQPCQKRIMLDTPLARFLEERVLGSELKVFTLV